MTAATISTFVVDEKSLGAARTFRVLLISNDADTTDQLRSILASEPDVRLVRDCGNLKSACSLLPHLDPDIVYFDVDLAGELSLDLFTRLNRSGVEGVIALSSLETHARRAYDAGARDFLVKPIGEERVRISLERARTWLMGVDAQNPHPRVTSARSPDIQGGVETVDQLHRLTVRVNEDFVFFRADQVDYFEGSGNYVKVHVGGSSYRLRVSLRELSARLDSRCFRRIHRSSLVNMERIKKVQPWFGGDYVAILSDGRQLRVSRTYAGNLLKPLQ